MSRLSTIKALAAICVATAVVLSTATVVRANIYLDLQDATTGSRTDNVTSSNESFTLDVYALVTPNGANVADNTKLGLTEVAAGFLVASSALQGDVTWGSWNTGGAQPISALASQAGATFTSSYGALGLGSSTTSTGATQTAWYIASENTVNTTGGSVLSNVGVEYLLGTIKVNFGTHTLPTVSTSASMVAIPDYGTAAAKKYQFIQDGASQSVQGSNALVGPAASSTNILYSNAAAGISPMTFTFGTPVISASGNATLSSASASSVMTGGTTAISFTLSNTGTVANQETISWNVTGAAALGSLSTASGTGLAPGTSVTPTPSLTYTAPTTAVVFGPVPVTLSATGTGTTLPATGSTLATSVNLINNSAVVGTTLTATIPAGGSLTLLETILPVNLAQGILGTTATILQGPTVTTPTTVTMKWRIRMADETPAGSVAAGGVSAGFLPVYSDVVDLSGVPTGTPASTYVLQMTYDPNQFGGTAGAENAASGGFIMLGYRSTDDSKWHNAVTTTTTDGNTGVGADAVANFSGSWAAFVAGPGAGQSLANLLGSWGVDTSKNTAWAYVDHDAEFAVVPEPGTLALLAAGVVALGVAYRRRKVAKA